MISRESDLINTKQEESNNTSDGSKLSKPSSASTTSSWSRLKDPRIVRVSRAFGGKDRHSKVCTVRGLRDRRVRLSVPTAIQLYDLQDRLGLNQPSKVVDWLLNAAKDEIDELPPLQIPPGSMINHNLQPYLDSQAAKHGLNINDVWGKPKDLFVGETSESREDSWARSTDQEFQENHQGTYNFSSNNFISRQNNDHPNMTPNLLNSGSSNSVPYNSFVRWDPSNLTLSQPQRSHLVQPNFSLSSLQSTSQPFLVYQHGSSTQNYFPSQIAPMDSEFALKQLNFQSSSITTSQVDSSTQAVRQFQFGMTADLLPRNEEDKDEEFH